MSYDILFSELIERLKQQIFKEATLSAPLFRAGCAVGYKTNGEIIAIATRINENLPDLWEGDDQYSLYASYKCVTALEKETDTVDSDESPVWAGASHRGGCVLFLEDWNVYVAIGFSGLTSKEDGIIAKTLLECFFRNNKE